MKISYVQPIPEREVVMTFAEGDGWAIIAALTEYADQHPSAVGYDKWKKWAKDLDALLRHNG